MKKYFIADPHFGHANMIRLADRPFSDVEEMDRTLIQNWNNTVGKEDEIYIIGDFSWYSNPEKVNFLLKKLNGKKYLITGNHDHFLKNKNFDRKQFVWIKEYAEIKQDGTKIVLFHYPIEEWNGFYRGSVHIHGHQHNKQEYNVKQQKLNLKRYDAGVDANNYTPVSLEHILEFTKNASNMRNK
jgi:hydrolase